jgi:AcrR family transcriptional regulator
VLYGTKALLATETGDDRQHTADRGPGRARPRADGRRYRRRVIDAAHTSFAEHGLGAQIDDIARDAGVAGTVYRRLPTKEALLEALAADQVRRLTAWAHEALADGDAGEAFRGYLRRVAELHAADRTLSDVVASCPGAFPRLGPALDALNAATSELLRWAQAAGEVRPDASGADIAALMCGLGRPAAAFGDRLRPQRYDETAIAGCAPNPPVASPPRKER